MITLEQRANEALAAYRLLCKHGQIDLCEPCIRAVIRACVMGAIREEMTRCAEIAETHVNRSHYMGKATADSIAKLIRNAEEI